MNDVERKKRKNEIKFITRWNSPVRIIKALSKKYPKAEFNLIYKKEHTPYDEEKLVIQNTEIISHEIITDVLLLDDIKGFNDDVF